MWANTFEMLEDLGVSFVWRVANDGLVKPLI